MHSVRPFFAEHPMRFGRRPVHVRAATLVPAPSIADDVKLFAATFIAGFVFVSILIS